MLYTTICEDCDGKGIDPGSLREPEDCLFCNGSGKTHFDIEVNDVIEYLDDEDKVKRVARVIAIADGSEESPYEGWVRVLTADDEPDIHVDLICRVLTTAVEFGRKERKVA